MKRILCTLISVIILFIVPLISSADDKTDVFLVHLKTSLKKDDAQICVAYNVMWAALEEGFKVKVLIDADAINTYKMGWKGKDDIEEYNIPENLRQALSKQFDASLDRVPTTYGDFLLMLKDRGVGFYINTGFLMVSKIGTPNDPLNPENTIKITMKET